MHACFHSVTAIVGAGVLGLPNTLVYLTWKTGIAAHLLFYFTSLFSLWCLCDLHEIHGKRFNRYHELAQYAFGEKLGLLATVPAQVNYPTDECCLLKIQCLKSMGFKSSLKLAHCMACSTRPFTFMLQELVFISVCSAEFEKVVNCNLRVLAHKVFQCCLCCTAGGVPGAVHSVLRDRRRVSEAGLAGEITKHSSIAIISLLWVEISCAIANDACWCRMSSFENRWHVGFPRCCLYSIC